MVQLIFFSWLLIIIIAIIIIIILPDQQAKCSWMYSLQSRGLLDILYRNTEPLESSSSVWNHEDDYLPFQVHSAEEFSN